MNWLKFFKSFVLAINIFVYVMIMIALIASVITGTPISEILRVDWWILFFTLSVWHEYAVSKHIQ